MPLTDKSIQAARPADTTRKLSDGGGLYLELMPSGARYWRWKYRFAGREKRLALGVYPTVSLKKARAKRDEAKKLLADGIDPSAHRRAERQAQAVAAANSFEAVAKEWYQSVHKHQVVQAHAERNLRRLEVHLFPSLRYRPIAEISAPELLEVLRRIEERGHLETAKRVRTLAGQVFRYAVATARAERDPAADLRDALRPAPTRHHAAITDPDEIGALLRAIEAYGGQPSTRAALRLAPLVFVRPGELRQARWKDFDLDAAQWNYAPSKGGLPLITPLPQQAVDILSEQAAISGRWDWVFPSVRGKGRPLSNNTINAALRRMDFGGEMSGHGFRALARTVLVERLGYRAEVVEMQLGHRVRDAQGRAYNRTLWLDERREMLQHWSDYLDELRSGECNVVPMRPARERA